MYKCFLVLLMDNLKIYIRYKQIYSKIREKWCSPTLCNPGARVRLPGKYKSLIRRGGVLFSYGFGARTYSVEL